MGLRGLKVLAGSGIGGKRLLIILIVLLKTPDGWIRGRSGKGRIALGSAESRILGNLTLRTRHRLRSLCELRRLAGLHAIKIDAR